MNKRERQVAVKNALASCAIGTQEELGRRLRAVGCRVTQATLSRDMRELGVARIVEDKGVRYTASQQGADAALKIMRPIVGSEVTAINANESLVVVNTLSGCASGVAEFIDAQRYRDIIGTIAGDNTVLVVPGSASKTSQVRAFLKKRLFEG